MTDFCLLNYTGADGEPRPGLLVGDQVVDLAAAVAVEGAKGFSPASTLTLLANWDKALPALKTIAGKVAAKPKGSLANSLRPLDEVQLLAPLLYPSTIFCIAANYADHHLEMSNESKMPDKKTETPSFFQKTPGQTVVGPGAQIPLPRTSNAIDWEAELAVVIGKPAYAVSAKEAMSYVAGFTVMNDMSIRGPRAHANMTAAEKKLRADRFRRKNFDGSSPIGPWITPTEFAGDPYNMPIKLWVNGELKQDGNSGRMHYTIEEQIAYLSEHLTLRPGDVISTGTPAGVGAGKGTFLKAGDEIVTTVGNLGTLKTTFVPAK
jgi:2-keto-4-pentenoate hydratase/2-oxohepta-3-ene-1,7-dioic acid hydratase in catechol pathway